MPIEERQGKIFFLEDMLPDYRKDAMSKIVSLNPAVSYALNCEGKSYEILEDYYSEKDLRSRQCKFFFEQLNWFNLFDGFLRENISYCAEYNIPLAKANYLRLKYFIDTIIIYSRILSAFFRNNESIAEIVYVHVPYNEASRPSIFTFRKRQGIVFLQILRLLCAKRNIALVEEVVEHVTPSYRKEPCGKIRPDDSAAILFLKPQAKKIYNAIKYEKWKRKIRDKNLRKLHVLVMHAGSPNIDIPIKELINHNVQLYLKEKDYIVREDAFSRKRCSLPTLGKTFVEKLKNECLKCSEKLTDSMLVSWVNDRCLLDVSSVIMPFLKTFILYDCPRILIGTERMRRFYDNYSIDYVLARGNTDRNSIGPLLAAKYLECAKSICSQHSCSVLDMEVFGVFETETYDFLLTCDPVSHKYFKNSLSSRYRSNCIAILTPHYLKFVKRKVVRKRRKTRKSRERIVYLEKKFSGGVRCFNNMIYPLTWYFEFQKAVVDFFTKRKDVDFVYKHAYGQEWAERSIVRYIHDLRVEGCKHVFVDDRHFLELMKSADRVIMDYPSTALFEAAVVGLPVLALYADYFNILGYAKEVFGKSLQKFSSIEDALCRIETFLESEPEEYVINKLRVNGDFIDSFIALSMRDTTNG